jgi:DNA-binding NarL/FixJ family response regulator
MPRYGRKGASSSSSRHVRQGLAEPEHQVESPRRLETLTARELEILGLMADGLFNREISDRLWLAEETVKTHVHHVLAKLSARSRAHAVAIALRGGLVD